MKQILIIEDDEDMRAYLKRVFEIDKEIGFNVTTAETVKEAEKWLKEKPFDVAIVDLRLAEYEDGGLKIIKSISSIFRTSNPGILPIIYTAYPSYETCVEAMRQGAWDYIDKNSEDSINKVLKSIKEGLERRFSSETGPDSHWLEQHQSELKKNYPDKFVALIDGEIIDGHENLDELKEKMKKKYPDKKPYYLWIPRR